MNFFEMIPTRKIDPRSLGSQVCLEFHANETQARILIENRKAKCSDS